jgi:predicted peptidase
MSFQTTRRAAMVCALLVAASFPGRCAEAPRPGTTIEPKLQGAAATDHAQRLERFRNLPKQTAFETRSFTVRPGARPLRYLFFKPTGWQTNAFPLVLSLHGGGPRRQFEHLLEPNAPGFAYGLGRLVSPEEQRAHPSFVVAPLRDALAREFRLDTNRVYVTGQSMGGFGTWAMLAAEPARFAAAIPICGGGDPDTAKRIGHVPVWAFHGSADRVVSVENTRRMIAALESAGARPAYWEYTDATHAETAERAYCEPGLLHWLFAQRRPSVTPAAPR